MKKELTLDATLDNIAVVSEFVRVQLEQAGCSMKAQMRVAMAIDELFSNIAHYAYGDEGGNATVCVETHEGENYADITFIDHGTPYNPLEKADPDVTESAEERKIGGLGIFLVKKVMDGISYKWEDGCNILTVRKNF